MRHIWITQKILLITCSVFVRKKLNWVKLCWRMLINQNNLILSSLWKRSKMMKMRKHSEMLLVSFRKVPCLKVRICFKLFLLNWSRSKTSIKWLCRRCTINCLKRMKKLFKDLKINKWPIWILISKNQKRNFFSNSIIRTL